MMSLCIDLHALERISCPKPSNLHHYVIIRKDIPFGDQLAQSIHAAAESPGPKPEPGTHAYALHALDEYHLNLVAARLDKAGIRYCRVVECPDDVDFPNQLMAIGVEPTEDKASVKKILSSLPLARM